MRFPAHRKWLSLAAIAAVLAVDLAAEDATPNAAAPTAAAPGNPIVTTPDSGSANDGLPVSSRPRRNRVISSDLAAQLSAATPKYTPPPPKPPPRNEEDLPDLREIDKPKNGIVRLPKYTVHEKPPPVLNERVVSTKKGFAELASKRYLTEADRALNRFTLPLFGSSAEQRAIAMYEEDERLKNMAELNDDARMVSATDKAAGLYVKRAVDSTFIRDGNFDWKPIGR
jgi:hypothetical protein